MHALATDKALDLIRDSSKVSREHWSLPLLLKHHRQPHRIRTFHAAQLTFLQLAFWQHPVSEFFRKQVANADGNGVLCSLQISVRLLDCPARWLRFQVAFLLWKAC